MKEKIKSEMRSCEICGYPVVNYESGVCMRCEKCGWQSGGDNIEYEKRYGISYPMVVPLSRAKVQYKAGKPFKATFEDFIHGLDFYSEMAFTYKGVKYGVCYRNDYSVLFYNEMQAWSFPTKDEFYKSASIDGNLLKDIWDEVQEPRYM